ncbi:MAG: hypothetical protein WAZ40_02140 [Minisyncoccia bacterium]
MAKPNVVMGAKYFFVYVPTVVAPILHGVVKLLPTGPWGGKKVIVAGIVAPKETEGESPDTQTKTRSSNPIFFIFYL